jgi:hypothetical protein
MVNLVNASLLASVTSQQTFATDLPNRISVDSSGVSSFFEERPEITFLFMDRFVQSIQEISVPTDNSSVRQIAVTYIASKDGSTLMTDSRGNVITDQSPLNNPRITMNPSREGVYGFILRILATSDNATPKGVRVRANGCQRSSEIIFIFESETIISSIQYR